MKRGVYRVINRRQAIILMALVFAVAFIAVALISSIPAVFTSVIKNPDMNKPICCTDRSDNVLSLTFDTSRGDEQIEPILRTLKQHSIKSTFFVTGEWAERCFSSIKKLADSGQEIMNASDKSVGMTSLFENDVIYHINAGSDKIQAITGKRPILFRPPDGEYDDNLLESLALLEIYPIGWDVDSLDIKGFDTDAIVKRVVSQAASGSIIRLNADGENTPDVLPDIIKQLKQKGYTFIPVSEIIHKDNYTINRFGRQITLDRHKIYNAGTVKTVPYALKTNNTCIFLVFYGKLLRNRSGEPVCAPVFNNLRPLEGKS
ncbi:MAG: polysaccharide deacetylase family protein [Oscillospiraceae bacterium]|nr:polysaccharide deacetylase family protein [Oscillospiraceae bacterium]MDD4413669.1 polysaccharide deacetylase family protein [Oscillospiraceae bacterium]